MATTAGYHPGAPVVTRGGTGTIGAATALLIALLVSGCAGNSVTVFEEPGFGIVFSYPNQMSLRTDVRTATRAGDVAPTDKTVALALDRVNLITISRHTLRTPVTDANLNQAKLEFDRLITQLSPTAAPGVLVQRGGLPGLEYEFPVPSLPGERSRRTILFDGDTEYTLDCQSTTEKRELIDKACDTTVDTVHRR